MTMKNIFEGAFKEQKIHNALLRNPNQPLEKNLQITYTKQETDLGTLHPHIKEYLREQNNGKNLHSFNLNNGIIQNTSREEMLEVCSGLNQAGLLHLPFPAVVIQFNSNHFYRNLQWYKFNDDPPESLDFPHITTIVYDDFRCERNEKDERWNFRCGMDARLNLRYIDGGRNVVDGIDKSILDIDAGGFVQKDSDSLTFIESIGRVTTFAAGLLVAALATRNTMKTYSYNKRIGTGQRPKAKFEGPDRSTIYLSITSLDVPPRSKMTNDPDNPARLGVSPRPHWRMGHAHKYWIGSKKGDRSQITKFIPPIFVNADPDFVQSTRKYVVTP